MRRARFLQLSAASLALCGFACREEPRNGELIVAISTDMAMPDQIDTAWVQVQSRGEVVLATPYEVGSSANKHRIPATLTLAVGDDPSQPVTIRVAGEKLGTWRTFREVVTTVPADRSALLRMPIQWLCDKSAHAVASTDSAGVTESRMLSICDEQDTCMAGVCRPKLIESSELPDYRPEAVWGGGSEPSRGTCFDTIACLDRGRIVEPDQACTVEKPDGESLNFALRVTDDGICDSIATACFVPLDAASDEGWMNIEGSDRVQLTEGVCNKLRSREATALYASTQCAPKTAAQPPCGTWSSVSTRASTSDAGSGGELPVAPPKATLVADLLSLDPLASLCCPLMADGGKLYSCTCRSKSEATLVSVDPAQGRPTTVGMIDPAPSRDRLRFAATVFEGSMYWHADQDLVRRTPLPGSSDLPASFPLMSGAVYENTSLVVSSAGVFVLASGVTDAPGAPVQMLGITPSMNVRSFDTGATQPVFQFDHDDGALYLAVDIDEPDGPRTRRTTRVVRMDKQSGALTPILNDQVITIDDGLRGGGYTGVQVDGGILYALFEGAPTGDGTTPVQVQRVELANPSAMRVVYEVALDRKKSQLGLLGAVDGAVLLARIELGDSGAVSRSSVLVLGTESDVPRIVGDYSRDYPALDLVRDDNQVYWLNGSGRLFGLARAALQ